MLQNQAWRVRLYVLGYESENKSKSRMTSDVIRKNRHQEDAPSAAENDSLQNIYVYTYMYKFMLVYNLKFLKLKSLHLLTAV